MLLGDPQAFRGNRMTRLKAASMQLVELIDAALATHRGSAAADIDIRWESLQASAIFLDATVDAQHRAEQQFEAALERIRGATDRCSPRDRE